MRNTTDNRRTLLSSLTGWLIIVVIVAAPFFYGCTRPWTQDYLAVALGAIAAVWLLSLVVEQRRPRVNALLLGAVGVLLVQGWSVVWFADPPVFDTFTARHISRLLSRWPSSVTVRLPGEAMSLITGLLVCFVAVADLAHRTTWKRRFIVAVVGTAVAVVGLGLLQNATHAPGIYWKREPMPGAFFGPFFHHTAAGAFINLAWGGAVCCTLYALGQHLSATSKHTRSLVFGGIALAVLAAGHLGHISRFPQAIAVGITLVILALFRPWTWFRGKSRHGMLVVAGAVLAVGLVAALASRSNRVAEIAGRWQMVIDGQGATAAPYRPPPPQSEWPRLMRDDLFVAYGSENYWLQDRGASYALAWDCIKEAPLLGYGPASWTATASTHSTNPFLRTFYLYVQFTHQDFLQALLEWGFLGGSCWALIVLGGVFIILRQQISIIGGSAFGSEGNVYRLSAAAGVLAVCIQSLLDFPLQIGAVQLYVAVLAGICWSRRHETHRSNPPHRRSPEKTALETPS